MTEVKGEQKIGMRDRSSETDGGTDSEQRTEAV